MASNELVSVVKCNQVLVRGAAYGVWVVYADKEWFVS